MRTMTNVNCMIRGTPAPRNRTRSPRGGHAHAALCGTARRETAATRRARGVAASASAAVSVSARLAAPGCSPVVFGTNKGGLISRQHGCNGPVTSGMNQNRGGLVVYAIRHGKRLKKLGRPADQRKALIRGLTTELLRHGRITTHENRAKAMRKYVDHIITLAKRGDEHAKRQAKSFIYDEELVDAVFEEVGNRYGDRNGGYTRIFHTGPRRGDNTKMAIIELV